MVGLNEGLNMNKNIMGYFKSIQTFIRSLFYKQQEQTKQVYTSTGEIFKNWS